MSYYDEELATIVGKKVTRIRMDETYLAFETDAGTVAYEVEGDCCSHSYFFDFYGVRNLLDFGPVTAFESVELSPGDPGYYEREPSDEPYRDDEIQVYGYRLTVEHPQLGDVSAVFSFRNRSNGYYGGWMQAARARPETLANLPELTEDRVGE